MNKEETKNNMKNEVGKRCLNFIKEFNDLFRDFDFSVYESTAKSKSKDKSKDSERMEKSSLRIAIINELAKLDRANNVIEDFSHADNKGKDKFYKFIFAVEMVLEDIKKKIQEKKQYKELIQNQYIKNSYLGINLEIMKNYLENELTIVKDKIRQVKIQHGTVELEKSQMIQEKLEELKTIKEKSKHIIYAALLERELEKIAMSVNNKFGANTFYEEKYYELHNAIVEYPKGTKITHEFKANEEDANFSLHITIEFQNSKKIIYPIYEVLKGSYVFVGQPMKFETYTDGVTVEQIDGNLIFKYDDNVCEKFPMNSMPSYPIGNKIYYINGTHASRVVMRKIEFADSTEIIFNENIKNVKEDKNQSFKVTKESRIKYPKNTVIVERSGEKTIYPLGISLILSWFALQDNEIRISYKSIKLQDSTKYQYPFANEKTLYEHIESCMSKDGLRLLDSYFDVFTQIDQLVANICYSFLNKRDKTDIEQYALYEKALQEAIKLCSIQSSDEKGLFTAKRLAPILNLLFLVDYKYLSMNKKSTAKLKTSVKQKIEEHNKCNPDNPFHKIFCNEFFDVKSQDLPKLLQLLSVFLCLNKENQDKIRNIFKT